MYVKGLLGLLPYYLPIMSTTLLEYLITTYSSFYERKQLVKWMWEWEQE